MMGNLQKIEKLLSGNSYPGRGILLGRSADGRHAVAAYFIMGRSENSRNRVFVTDGEGIRTEAFDPAKLKDPSLIIYAPVRVFHGADSMVTIVTNGDQTDTLYGAMEQEISWEQALRSRTFEPDAPNFTPRISGGIEGFNYRLSILKSADGNPACAQRFHFEYENPPAGEGRLIHTYRCDGDPIPSFDQEPIRVAVEGEIDQLTARLWENLNADNKVALFVRYIDVAAGTFETRIVNKNQSEGLSCR